MRIKVPINSLTLKEMASSHLDQESWSKYPALISLIWSSRFVGEEVLPEQCMALLWRLLSVVDLALLHTLRLAEVHSVCIIFSTWTALNTVLSFQFKVPSAPTMLFVCFSRVSWIVWDLLRRLAYDNKINQSEYRTLHGPETFKVACVPSSRTGYWHGNLRMGDECADYVNQEK